MDFLNSNLSMQSAQSLPVWLELAAMMITGLFGAAVARGRNTPIYGTLLCGVIVGLGGGMTRDMLLNVKPVAIYTWYYIPAILFAALVGALFFSRIIKQQIPNLLIDGVAMGLLISIGAQKALVHQTPIFAALFCGVATASVGGMIADVLTQNRAEVVSQAHWLGVSLTLGTVGYLAGSIFFNFYVGVVVAVVVTTALRVLSVTKNWPSPNWSKQGANS
jgi:uncharacterized membrane protein YeiH